MSLDLKSIEIHENEKRRRFDAGEIDASGQERAERRFYHQYAGQDAGQRYDSGFGAERFSATEV